MDDKIERMLDLLFDVVRQLERLNETIEAIRDGNLNVEVRGGINTHTY